MSGKGYYVLFFVMFVNLIINQEVFGDESIEESQPYYEYSQIFRSIPTLFEYLFDAIEDRPEILEKNDVTMFERNIDGLDIDECESTTDKGHIERRNVDCDKPVQDTNNSDKSDTKDVTTVAYEYGNSNVIMNRLDDTKDNREMSERLANKNYIKRTNKEILMKENRINSRKRINDDFATKSKDYGEAFVGLEHLFGLDLKPEDIEERILTAEKLLEEHNNKKDNEN